MYTESVVLSSHLILCCPLLLLYSVFPNIRVFSNESVLPIRWPKYWSFSISPSNEYCFPLGLTGLNSLQSKRLSRIFNTSSKASILQCSAFLVVQLTSVHDYWKTSFDCMDLCWQSDFSGLL